MGRHAADGAAEEVVPVLVLVGEAAATDAAAVVRPQLQHELQRRPLVAVDGYSSSRASLPGMPALRPAEATDWDVLPCLTLLLGLEARGVHLKHARSVVGLL